MYAQTLNRPMPAKKRAFYSRHDSAARKILFCTFSAGALVLLTYSVLAMSGYLFGLALIVGLTGYDILTGDLGFAWVNLK